MRSTPSRDTQPERLLRSVLQKSGLRFRKDTAPVAGLRCKADIVFPKAKVCVFVDGCFWHGCREHFVPPKVNTAWWVEKILDNTLRDEAQTRALRKSGWTVLRYWEHDMKGDGLKAVAGSIEKALRP